MIFNNSVTLYHKKNEEYERKYFVRACVFNEDKIKTGNGGQVDDDSFIIRIFTYDTPEISPGDRLVLGYSETISPPEDSNIILSVTKNFRGSGNTRHVKIKAM